MGHRADNKAKHEQEHADRQAQRKLAADPAKVAAAYAYFATLDDSHKYVFLGNNPRMAESFVGLGGAYNAEVQRIEGGSAYQTADLKPIDPTVQEGVWQG